MSVVLALTLRVNPQNLDRLEALMPFISTLYSGLSIASPPTDDDAQIGRMRAFAGVPIKLRVSEQKAENRRYYTLQHAVTFDNVSHVHYCDGDHAIARMERDPDEWRGTVDALQETDCLVIGRTEQAMATYAPALVETERIINMVASHLVGQAVDLGAGSRGFSREAVEFLLRYALPQTHGLATDSEWVVLLHRGGFRITSYLTDSAFYEVANEATRAQLESVEQWTKRARIAQIIVQAGLDVASRNDLPEH